MEVRLCSAEGTEDDCGEALASFQSRCLFISDNISVYVTVSGSVSASVADDGDDDRA